MFAPDARDLGQRVQLYALEGDWLSARFELDDQDALGALAQLRQQLESNRFAPSMIVSRLFKTLDARILIAPTGAATCTVTLSRERPPQTGLDKHILPADAVLAVTFDNPALPGTKYSLDATWPVADDRLVLTSPTLEGFSAADHDAKLVLCDIAVFTDAAKTQQLGQHRQLLKILSGVTATGKPVAAVSAAAPAAAAAIAH